MLNKAVFARTIKKPESDKLQILSNPNLLDNGDFQVWQKGNKFTISKQRIYAADRWMAGSDDGAVTTERSDGLLVTCTETGGALISQVISMEETNLRGQTVTLTAHCDYSPEISPSLCLYSNEGNGYHLLKTVHFFAGNILTATIPTDANFIAFEVNSAGVPLSPGQFVRLKHAKLEAGPCFTGFLPISYADDLRRCQRYLANSISGCTFRANKISENSISFAVPVPVTMRGNPKIVSGSTRIRDLMNNPQDGFIFSCLARVGCINIDAIKTSHKLTDAVLGTDSLILDANL